MSTEVKTDNSSFGNNSRLAYFDPNVSVYQNNEGNYSDSITFPYEDYNIAVDLMIREYNRYSCGLSNVSGEFIDYKYSTSNGTISFLGGTKYGSGDDSRGYLTTKYTDVSMTNPQGNTQECLGIESITITYQSWFHPQVTIKFIDVRGATVMLQSENAYYNKDELGTNYQLYKAFFSFPYPLFVLKVKGFYGKGVSYKLAVSKTTIDFDANSGNFVITAEFIGHMYGIFADLPMTFLSVAPYTKVGSEYWDKKVADGTFCFRGPGNMIQGPMIKFPRLKESIATAITNLEVIDADKELSDTESNAESKISDIKSLMAQYEATFKNEITIESESKKEALYIWGEGLSSDFSEKAVGFFSSLSGHDASYGTSYYQKFGGDSMVNQLKSLDKHKMTLSYQYDKKYEEKIYKPASNDSQSDVFYQKFFSIDADGKTGVLSLAKNLNSFTVYVFEKSGESFKKIAYTEFQNELSSINDEKDAFVKKANDKKNAAIEKALGFTPSIRNIFELAFAHMDTFLEVFYTYMKEIKSQLDGKSVEREKDHYLEIKDDEDLTDTEKRRGDSSLIRANYLPPFTGFYKINRDPEITDNNGTIKKKVQAWPGKFVNGNDLLEVGFIVEMIHAARMYFEDNKLADSVVADILSGNTSNGGNSTSVVRFLPLTIYDISHNGNVENPYNQLLSDFIDDKNYTIGELMYIFAMRSFYYNSVLYDEVGNDTDYAYSFGRSEALNFYKAMGEKCTSKSFFEFLKKFSDDSDEKSESRDFVRYITTTEKIEGITDVWIDENAVNTNNRLFNETEDGKITYCYFNSDSSSNNFSYFPLDLNCNVKKDFVSGDELLNNKKYITTKFINKYSGQTDTFKVGEPLAGGSFFVIDDRDYLNKLFENIKTAYDETSEKLKNRDKNKFGDADIEALAGLREKDIKRLQSWYKTVSDDFYNDKFAIQAEDGYDSGRKELRRVMQSGTSEDISHYYITNPTKVNEKSDSSLFESPLYWMQPTVEAKACLLTQALPLLGNNKTAAIDKYSYNGVTAKSVLLREGAIIWMEKHKNDENFMKWSDGTNSYKIPADGQWLASDWDSGWFDGASYDTYNPIPTSDTSHDYFTYNTKRYGRNEDGVDCGPIDANPSRASYLEQYFLNWVNTEFNNDSNPNGNMRKLLENKELYNENEYHNGINSGMALNNKAISGLGKDSENLQKHLRNLLFGMVTTFDYYEGTNGLGSIYCTSKQMRNSFKGFIDGLERIYGEYTGDIESGEIDKKVELGKGDDPFESDDLKLSTYMTMKNLYDRWICGSYNGEETYRFRRSNGDGSSYELDNFMYCDNYFHDIGWNLLVNVTKVGEWMNQLMPSSELIGEDGNMSFTSKSIYEFLSEIAEMVGAYILAVPQKIMYTDRNSVIDAFTPIPSCRDWDDDSSTYMVLYSYKPSEHLGGSESSNIDLNGWSPEGDGFDLTNDDICGTLFNDDGTVVPAFGVTVGKQNQSYFKNITLSSASPGITEVGISNTLNIASKSGAEVRETTLFGQDIYKVYSNYSYECTVEMLGCMQIFPPMYFQLNNVPMWKGAYMIQKVSHNIKPGDITTTFTGVRQNKYAIPMANGDMIGFIGNSNNLGSANVSDTNVTDSNIGTLELYDTTEKNIEGDRSMSLPKVDESDFDSSNITKAKPLICITPAHGPRTSKSAENAWSSNLIDNYIIPKLRSKTFKDGTSYSKNIHRCNVGGKNTDSNGYSYRETNSLVSKYGSKCVIAIAPHWNGCHGQRHETYDGKQIGTKTYYENGKWKWWKDPRNPRYRKDSAVFAAYMREEAKKVYNKKDEYQFMPSGMMDDGVNTTTHLLYTEVYGKGDKSDPAVNPDCACILTENWFGDYVVEGGAGWLSRNYKELGSDNRYQNGRAWLESEEGLNVIADMHVSGIVNYINSLSDE